MSARLHTLVYDIGCLGVLGLFCALLAGHHGFDAGGMAFLLVFLAYVAGRRAD